MFWAVAFAAGWGWYAQRVRPVAANYATYNGPTPGRLVGPVRRTRQGWKTLFEFSENDQRQKAQLWLPKGGDPGDYVPGRDLVVYGQMRPPRRPRDPGDDDEEARVRAAGAQWVFRAESVVLSTAAISSRWRAHAAAQAARLSAEESFRRRLSPEKAALLAEVAVCMVMAPGVTYQPTRRRSMYFLILCWPIQTFWLLSRSTRNASIW